MANPMLDPEGFEGEQRPTATPSEPSRPYDMVELPSHGLLYPEGHPLHGKTHIPVFYLTAKEEDILTSPNLIRSGKLLDHLLKAVIVEKGVEPEDMLLGDRNTIFVWLRSTGYGSEYSASLRCQHCGEQFTNTFDLAALDLRNLQVTPAEDGLFEVKLPTTGKTARVNFLTAREDAEVDSMIEKRAKKLGGTGNPMTAKLFAYVKDVDEVPADDLKSFIESLPVADSRAIRKFIADNEPTILMRQDADCTECGETNEEVPIPIGTSFFWPDA